MSTVLSVCLVLAAVGNLTDPKVITLESHEGTTRVAISLDGKVAASTDDKSIKLWDTVKATPMLTIPVEGFGISLAFTPDKKAIAVRLENSVDLHVLPDASAVISADVEGAIVFHDWATGAEQRRLQTSDSCRALAVSHDGKVLGASARNAIETWNLALGKPMSPLHGHENWVVSLAIAPDGSAMVSGSSDDTVRLWRLP